MSERYEPRVITTDEVLEVSSASCVTLQDENHEPLDGLYFSDDQIALRYIWSNAQSDKPLPMSKLDIPLELPMLGEFKLADEESGDRPAEDFRIVMPDRRVAPARAEGCTVMPYLLHNGITTLFLDLTKSENLYVTGEIAINLNINEPESPHPITKSTDPVLQVLLTPEIIESGVLFDKYEAHKREAGRIIQRIVNTPVFE